PIPSGKSLSPGPSPERFRGGQFHNRDGKWSDWSSLLLQFGCRTRTVVGEPTMLAPCPLYHTIATRIAATTAPVRLPAPSLRRLALLVTGLVAAQSTTLARIATELFALQLTAATTSESIGRRLRRTLSDPLLIAEE